MARKLMKYRFLDHSFQESELDSGPTYLELEGYLTRASNEYLVVERTSDVMVYNGKNKPWKFPEPEGMPWYFIIRRCIIKQKQLGLEPTPETGQLPSNAIPIQGAYLISGAPGVGKSTLVDKLRSQGYNAVDLDKLGHHEDRTDRQHWIIPKDKVAALVKKGNLLAFGMCSNLVTDLSTLDWTKKLWLELPWEQAIPRIVQRLQEKKNTFPRDGEEWRNAEACYKKHTHPGFENIDATGTVDETAGRIIKSLSTSPSIAETDIQGEKSILPPDTDELIHKYLVVIGKESNFDQDRFIRAMDDLRLKVTKNTANANSDIVLADCTEETLINSEYKHTFIVGTCLMTRQIDVQYEDPSIDQTGEVIAAITDLEQMTAGDEES